MNKAQKAAWTKRLHENRKIIQALPDEGFVIGDPKNKGTASMLGNASRFGGVGMQEATVFDDEYEAWAVILETGRGLLGLVTVRPIAEVKAEALKKIERQLNPWWEFKDLLSFLGRQRIWGSRTI